MSRKSKSQPKAVPVADWVTLHPDAAGLDIGASKIWVAVPPDPHPARCFFLAHRLAPRGALTLADARPGRRSQLLKCCIFR
jgi:hypothetical protein